MQSSNQLIGTFLCAWYMLALFPMLGPTAIPNANHLKPTQEAAKLQFVNMSSAAIYVAQPLSIIVHDSIITPFLTFQERFPRPLTFLCMY